MLDAAVAAASKSSVASDESRRLSAPTASPMAVIGRLSFRTSSQLLNGRRPGQVIVVRSEVQLAAGAKSSQVALPPAGADSGSGQLAGRMAGSPPTDCVS